MAGKTTLHVLTSGMALDRAALLSLDIGAMNAVIAEIRAHPQLPVVVITSADDFFTADNAIAMIRQKDKGYKLIAEHAKIEITNDDVAALWAADATVAKIKAAMVPKWTFQQVPEGWTIKDDLSLGDTRIRRKRKNAQGHGVDYYFTPEQAQKLWTFAAKRWATQNPHLGADSHEVSANGGQYKRKVSVSSQQLTIGCQSIMRYELEQLAKYRGWPFPAIA